MQFMKLSNYLHDKAASTHATLNKIPNQLVVFLQTWYNATGNQGAWLVPPIKWWRTTAMQSILIHMKFGIDDEVALNGDQSAAHIDFRFKKQLSVGFKYCH